MLKEWKPNVVIVVAKNPRYWNAARVALNEIRFYPIEQEGTEERAFRTGQLHVTFTVPPSKLATYLARRAPELQSAVWWRTEYLTFGTQRPPFTDARVRRAFSLAIDRERVAATVLKGRGDAAFTMARSGTGGYSVPAFSRHDPVEAKRLLREAGFPDGAGFPSVEFTLSGQNEAILTLAQALQEMWRKTLGVEVRLAPTEPRVLGDLMRTKSFTIIADTWHLAYSDPVDILAQGVTGDLNNAAGWSNARYDAAFAAIESAPDDAARLEAITTCERINAEEAPYAPVFYAVRNQLVHPSVRGWKGNPLQRIDWTALSLAAPK